MSQSHCPIYNMCALHLKSAAYSWILCTV